MAQDEGDAESSSSEQERSPSGAPVYRHKERTKPFEIAVGDSETIGAVEEHIAKHIGPTDWVFHEILSDLVHIDVHVVTPRNPPARIVLATSGMSDRPMTTPIEAAPFRFADLMISLPVGWPLGKGEIDMDQSPLKDERNYWPIRILKMMARMPHEYSTWLGHGHTIGGDEPDGTLPGSNFAGVILLHSAFLPDDFWELKVPGRTIFMYALVPLYREEILFKRQHGVEKLLDQFERAGVIDQVEIINPARRNACAKRRWWRFGR